MADLTLITHVYNAQQPVDRQLALWQQFSPALRSRLQFLVIDDHSDEPLQVDKGELDLRLVRVSDDIDWNMPGCRNLAATPWMLFFDVDNVAMLTPTARAEVAADVVAKLTAYATKLAQIAARTERLAAPDRWAAEVIDGVAMARLRAQFIAAIYRAAVAAADGDAAAGATELAAAEATLAEARTVVARRHADLHDADPRLTDAGQNYTLYQYGYLYFANSLCFWERERVMAANAVRGTATIPPGCFFP